MTLTIRQAVKGDGRLVLSFIRELAAYERLEHEVVADLSAIDQTLFAVDPKVFALIAEWEGEPCGFALYFFNYSTFLGRHGIYLEDLFVSESRRGRGIGKSLLARLAQIAKENDCGRLEWWVLDSNTPAIEFYKSLGALPMRDWTVFRLTGDALDVLAGA